jgi:hypothetical protein
LSIFLVQFHCKNCCNNCNTRVGISSELATWKTINEDFIMNRTNKSGRNIFSLVITAALILLITAAMIPGVMGAGPATVNIGAASHYAILSKTAITNVAPSEITGDIGVSPITGAAITGFTCPELLTGKAHVVDGASSIPACTIIDPLVMTPEVLAMEAAYTDAATRPDPTIALDGDMAGDTLAPGLYKTAGAELITGDVTLSVSGYFSKGE